MRVVVTGATGNVGTSVVSSLAAEPEVDSILGIARREPEWSPPKTEWATADVASDDLTPLFRGADAVVHLAWQIQPSRDEERTRRTNVEGSRRTFEAAAAAGAGALVYASSVGAYSAGPKDRAVDESWPTEGIPSSFYSRHKAAVERLLDRFEHENPGVRSVRLRPGLIFKRLSGTEIRRLFAGPFLPSRLVHPRLIPLVPNPDGRLVVQAVHTDDVAEAYRLAVTSEVSGAFNVAADPVLDAETLARALGAKAVGCPPALLRGAAHVTWLLRLQPTPSGWVDMGLGVPLMDTTRAREELGWSESVSAVDALMELLGGIRESAGMPTPPLEPSSGPLRLQELRTAVGGRGY